jgi:spermidine synthase
MQIALFLVAGTTLLLELLLTRAFDVILTPNMAYMVIACAMFSLGLAGIYLALRPIPERTDLDRLLGLLGLLYAAAILAVLPAMNALPFDYEALREDPVVQLASFAGMYLALILPFFLAGLILAVMFSTYAKRIQSLYFWDLVGAAMGCVAIVPLLRPIGPGGLLFVAAGAALVASGLLSGRRPWLLASAVGGVVVGAIPFLRSPDYFEFEAHLGKRGVKEAKLERRVEFTEWDPVSKIDVFDQVMTADDVGSEEAFGPRKHVAYDGGTQSSHFFPFDGDFAGLRRRIEAKEADVWDHFWHRGVFASHHLKADQGARVLIVGSAAGQETKAALMYGASHVDGVELVGTVVRLGRTTYAEYAGRLFDDPRVTIHVGEGRSFLRGSPARYDIIQMHSNHTSSSVAAGTGAMSPNYLQTTDAYEEYFDHLSEDGILHINHNFLPRMITTAATAWKEMGRSEFERHVLAFSMPGVEDTVPTFLVKMSPWTRAEVQRARRFFSDVGDRELPFRVMHDPFDADASFLPPVFFSGELPDEIADRVPYRISAATDDAPFFDFIRKTADLLPAGEDVFTPPATAMILNAQRRGGPITMDTVHLYVTGIVSLGFALVFVLIPLLFAGVGRSRWPGRYASLLYFSCLGGGFILFELVFIQIFMKLVGFPVYTYTVVLFTFLLGAGLGSLSSELMGIGPRVRWWWPFAGIVVYGGLLCVFHPDLFSAALGLPVLGRSLVAGALILPLSFVLGMPFPIGVLALSGRPPGAVAWAWGMNGLFTVIGGLASVLLSIAIGFQGTIVVAIAIYLVAFLSLSRLRRQATS